MKYRPEVCYFCGKPSEWDIYICETHLAMPLFHLMLSHPIKFFTVGYLHGLGKAPGDNEPS